VRLKTFVSTYLLFLCILYLSLGIVSVYLTNSQTDILREKSISEYHSIAATLSKDIAVLQGRNAGFSDANGINSLNALVNGYVQYYRTYDIEIAVSDSSLSSIAEQRSNDFTNTEISFARRGQGHFICIAGSLPEPLQFYQFDYCLDITKNMMEMQNIQNTLLAFAVAFSVLTAIALYFILSNIFKPLSVVADTSRKIADGQYSERLEVKGKNELSSMALNFNRMAEEIEKQMQVLEEEAVAKQQFADNLAHEIRTPLTSIYGYAEYIQKTSLSEEEIIESAQRIMHESGNMSKIANSLLKLATLRNYMAIKCKISISCLFDEISRTMEKSLRERGAQLVCHAGADADAMDGQEDLIKSLLVNLCSNALKSCPSSGGTIRLCAAKQGKGIVLSVTDNGCGIPKESISRVSEPFYRVDKARSREEGGAGLGLALCRQIAEAHGAELVIESAVGLGTTVKATFTSP